ncbi:MAG TPA: phosphoribosylglycinamide synthetase C domain-containing protein, partial [Polyangiales bacterium]|nr:phosphoribosylglycinamide synthetase C domain-containing protein [Polyangiales bacterium]
IDEHGVIWPLELTCRFGYPGFAILSALHVDGWDALFRTLLERRTPRFATRPGFAVGVVLTVPPFPYAFGYAHVSKGLPISFDPSLSAEDRAHLHYAEVALHEGQLVASGATGYLMVATGVGETVRGAQRAAYARAGKVYVPNVRYRHDIGDTLATGGIETLRALGYWDDDAVPREPAKSSRR